MISQAWLSTDLYPDSSCLHQLSPFCKAEKAVVGLGGSTRDAVSSWQRWNCCCSQVGKEEILIWIGVKNTKMTVQNVLCETKEHAKGEEKKRDNTCNTEWGRMKNCDNSTS